MQQISNLSVYTGIIPNKATQTDNEFANNIFGFLNYSGNTFVENFNTIIGQYNILSGEINTAAEQVAIDKAFVASAKTSVEQTIAVLANGTINDTTPGATKTYSSNKINSLVGTGITQSNRDTTSGRLLKFGDFGNGSAIDMGIANLNQVLPCGEYFFYNTSPNLPATGNHYVSVFASNSTTTIIQIARHSATGVTYSRGFNGEGWSSWAEIFTSGEIGTFEPRVIGGTTAGIGTYDTRLGYYEKYGNEIRFSLYVILSAHTGTGTLFIDGLPYLSSHPCTALTVGYLTGLTFSNPQVGAWMNTDGLIRLQSYGNGLSPSNIQMDTAFGIMISGTYRTA